MEERFRELAYDGSPCGGCGRDRRPRGGGWNGKNRVVPGAGVAREEFVILAAGVDPRRVARILAVTLQEALHVASRQYRLEAVYPCDAFDCLISPAFDVIGEQPQRR